ncbi:MAG: DUF2203 domain-containing protein [Candidatus Omnitrophica bacterium]|nr:DUF2203 domain-containing protein [Candidatus Omnitrophota bacterium]
MSQLMFQKTFTPQEANLRLPLVRSIVNDILEKGKAYQVALEKDEDIQISHQALHRREKIQELIAELEALGCFYKDWNFEVGLVDFPSVIHGEEVFLCWRPDEPKVQWYHGIAEGYSGRKPIPEEML